MTPTDAARHAAPAAASGRIERPRTEAEITALAERLLDPARTRPIVVASTTFGDRTRPSELPLDVDRVADEVGDVADVVVVETGEATWQLKALLPVMLQVYGGAARSYPTGLSGAGDGGDDARRSPLRFPHLRDRLTDAVITDALGHAHAAGLFTDRAESAHEACGTVQLIAAGRAIVHIDGDGMATVAQELTFAPTPLDWVLTPGQRVSGRLDPASRRLLLAAPAPTADELEHVFPHGSVTLALVAGVTAESATLLLHPAVPVRVARTDVSPNPFDRVDLLLTEGEVARVRVVHLSTGELHLRLSDVDDDESVLPAVSLLPGGRPWLVEGRSLEDGADEASAVEASPVEARAGAVAAGAVEASPVEAGAARGAAAPPADAGSSSAPGSAPEPVATESAPAPTPTPPARPAPKPGPGVRRVEAAPTPVEQGDSRDAPAASAAPTPTPTPAPAAARLPGPTPTPAPAPPPSAAPTPAAVAGAGAASVSSSAAHAEQRGALKSALDALAVAKARIAALERRLHDAEAGDAAVARLRGFAEFQELRARDALAEVGTLRRRVAELERDRRESSKLLRARTKTPRAETVAASPRERAARWADAEAWVRHELAGAWAERVEPYEQSQYPLREFRVGERFATTLLYLDAAQFEKALKAVVDVLTDRAKDLPGRDLHPLRDGLPGAPQLHRSDGAKAWRCAVEREVPSARRLHYWVCPDGVIELAQVGLHDEMAA